MNFYFIHKYYINFFSKNLLNIIEIKKIKQLPKIYYELLL
jgi:hypothetical protein